MCIMGSYVSFGRFPIVVHLLSLLRKALACRYASLWYMAGCAGPVTGTVTVTVTVCPVAKGKSNCYLGFLSNVCALVVVSCKEIMMVCQVVLNLGLLLRRCLSYLHVKIYVGFRILISLSHCY